MIPKLYRNRRNASLRPKHEALIVSLDFARNPRERSCANLRFGIVFGHVKNFDYLAFTEKRLVQPLQIVFHNVTPKKIVIDDF